MSFKSELKILQSNLVNKLDEIEVNNIPLPGHDDSRSYLRSTAIKEYNEELGKLKLKYNIQ